MAYLLQQLLTESAVKYPDKKALFFKDREVTYSELEILSNKLANILIENGLRRGDRVGIYMTRSIDSIVGILGILKASATYVPIDPFCPSSRLNYIISKCQIEFLLSSQDKYANIERSFSESFPLKKILVMDQANFETACLGSAELLFWPRIQESADGNEPRTKAINSDLAYILFTSGSTGNPKGVMISHLNSLTFIDAAHDFLRIQEEDIFSNISPLHFDLSIFDIFVSFKAGASLVIVPENILMFPIKLAEFIEKSRISVWNSVPSVLSLLANYSDLAKYNFSSLRLVLFAGEVFPVKYLRKLIRSIPQANFYNIYGQTEANSSTYYLIDRVPDEDNALIPIGKPFPNFDVFALDDDFRKITKSGTKGELYVRAASVAYGYWDEPDKTKENFVANPLNPHLDEIVFRTGDIVRLDDEENYIFLGRKDQMIKSRGYRVEIGEIESVLLNHPQIKNAVVVPIPDELIGNRIAAIIVPSDEKSIRKEDILKHCSKQLPKYMIPETLEFREALPMTSSGKVDRKKLIELMNG